MLLTKAKRSKSTEVVKTNLTNGSFFSFDVAFQLLSCFGKELF